jgi:5-hydroxyisourate hydrolase-like protein (transthyretin family)
MHNWFKTNKSEKSTRTYGATSFIYTALAALLFIMVLSAVSASANTVSTGDYFFQLQTEPAPPVAAQETLITLKVLHTQDGNPARRGKILIKLSEAEDTEETNRRVNNDISAFRKLKERDDFGNYEYKTVFPRHAPYHIDIAVEELSSIAFRPLVPMVLLSLVLVTLNVYLLNLPMAPRHIH